MKVIMIGFILYATVSLTMVLCMAWSRTRDERLARKVKREKLKAYMESRRDNNEKNQKTSK